MREIIFLFFFLNYFDQSFAQVRVPFLLEDKYNIGYKAGYSSDDIELFDKAEISHRHIKAAYVISHSSEWNATTDLNCIDTDTVQIYKFNDGGMIIERTNIQGPIPYRFYSTITYDESGNVIQSRTSRLTDTGMTDARVNFVSDRKKIQRSALKDGVVVVEAIGPINKGILDTFYTVFKFYNSYGHLKEFRSEPHKKYRESPDMDLRHLVADYAFHERLDYDSIGRVTKHVSDKWSYYLVIKYTGYGKLIQTYSSETNELIGENYLFMQQTDKEIIYTNKNYCLVFSRLAPKSKLFKLKTEISLGQQPSLTYYEISYSY